MEGSAAIKWAAQIKRVLQLDDKAFADFKRKVEGGADFELALVQMEERRRKKNEKR